MYTQVARADSAAVKSRGVASRWFYVGMTVLVILINVVAFGPSIVDPSARTVPLPLGSIDLAHSVVSVTWLLVFLAQVTPVLKARSAIHRQLGVAGVFLSVAFIVVTWLTLVEGARRGFDLSGDLVSRGTSQEPGAFLAPASTLVPLGAFVGAAVWYRRRPALHKRLMIMALLMSMGAPVAHLIGHWPAFAPYTLIGSTVIAFFPAIHDRVWEGRIHPLSLWGALVVTFWFPVFFFTAGATAAWRDFAVWVVQ